MGYSLINEENNENSKHVPEAFRESIQKIADAIVDIRNANSKLHLLPDIVLPAMLKDFINYIFHNMDKQ